MSDFRIRSTAPPDAQAIAAIYAHHVRTGLASFEETPPDPAEMATRIERLVTGGYPHLAAERDGTILGYAYAGPYHGRSAYRFTLEDSVYVAPGAQRQGVGRALLADVIARAEAGGFRQMLALIGDSANAGSIALHGALGFRPVGTQRAVGFKRGRWVDVVVMQRPLGPGADSPPD